MLQTGAKAMPRWVGSSSSCPNRIVDRAFVRTKDAILHDYGGPHPANLQLRWMVPPLVVQTMPTKSNLQRWTNGNFNFKFLCFDKSISLWLSFTFLALFRHVTQTSKTLEERSVSLNTRTHTWAASWDSSSALTSLWLGATISETTELQIATGSQQKKSL